MRYQERVASAADPTVTVAESPARAVVAAPTDATSKRVGVAAGAMLVLGAISILVGTATVVFAIHDLQVQGVGLINLPYGAVALALGVAIGCRSAIGLVVAATFLLLDTASELLAPIMGERISPGAVTVRLVVLFAVIQALLAVWSAHRAGAADVARDQAHRPPSAGYVPTPVMASSEETRGNVTLREPTRLGRRINAGFVMGLSAIGFFLTAASLDIMVDHHGGRALLTVAALACTVVWLRSLQLVMRWWVRPPPPDLVRRPRSLPRPSGGLGHHGGGHRRSGLTTRVA